MERKHVASVGVGVGIAVGLGMLAAKPILVRRIDSNSLQKELLDLVQLGKDGSVTVQDLPYYLNEQVRGVLTNAAFVHLKRAQFSKFASQLSPASRAILLSGPDGTEVYNQRIAKALAHNFEAKLLLLDVTDLVSKSNCGSLTRKNSANGFVAKGLARSIAGFFYSSPQSKATGSPVGCRSPNSSQSNLCELEHATSTEKPPKSEGNGMATETINAVRSAVSSPRRANATFEEEILVDALFKVLASISASSPVVVYLRDVDNFFFKGPNMYSLFLRKMKQMQGPVLILGSRIKSVDEKQDNVEATEKLGVLFRYLVNVKPPTEETPRLISWKSEVEEDMKAIQAQDNRNRLLEVLYANNMQCDDITSVGFSDSLLLGSYIEEVVVSALSYHLKNTEEPDFRGGKLLISAKSLAYGLSVYQSGQLESGNKLQSEKAEPNKELQEITTTGKSDVKSDAPIADVKADASKPDTPKVELPKKAEADAKPAAPPPTSKTADVVPDNEFEKRIRPEVIPAGEVGVNFDDIGALENVKESLQELVMLPLRRPELFSKGGLIKPCKGILLFGPPGTGKTMLAKAVATEAGASFINVSMSAITSKWFGEDEKNVRALFTLAAKVSPTVIFIDEVDSMLGQRSRVGEHEAMRKIKNEFMAHWDGLLTRGGEQVLVLAATNRPFDLDEAIIRRFERRIMVGLPEAESRERILKAILSKEKLADDFDFQELAAMTEGYSGSDLKNLCVTAAYQPVRELLQQERKQIEKKKNVEKALTKGEISNSDDAKEEKDSASELSVISLRTLTLEDLRNAKKQISASFASEGAGMQELQDWNELYGEGGSRKKQQLTYFL